MGPLLGQRDSRFLSNAPYLCIIGQKAKKDILFTGLASSPFRLRLASLPPPSYTRDWMPVHFLLLANKQGQTRVSKYLNHGDALTAGTFHPAPILPHVLRGKHPARSWSPPLSLSPSLPPSLPLPPSLSISLSLSPTRATGSLPESTFYRAAPTLGRRDCPQVYPPHRQAM